MAGLMEIAEAEGCTPMDWQTDGSNPLSQAFYAAMGAPQFDKRSYRITSDAFARNRAALERA